MFSNTIFRKHPCICWGRSRKPKVLFVFDFDITIVSKNSEFIYKKVVAKKFGVHESELDEPPSPAQWGQMSLELINHVFNDCGVTIRDLLEAAKLIPLVPGIEKLLHTLTTLILDKNNNSRFIILSGGNDLFITSRLSSMSPPVFPDEIIANHARVSADRKYFTYRKPYHHAHSVCRICNRTMCKGNELDAYFESHGRFIKVHFICDGTNDICAALRLRAEDTIYIRLGFGLDIVVKEGLKIGMPVPIKSKIVYWTDGHELLPKMIPVDLLTRRYRSVIPPSSPRTSSTLRPSSPSSQQQPPQKSSPTAKIIPRKLPSISKKPVPRVEETIIFASSEDLLQTSSAPTSNMILGNNSRTRVETASRDSTTSSVAPDLN